MPDREASGIPCRVKISYPSASLNVSTPAVRLTSCAPSVKPPPHVQAPEGFLSTNAACTYSHGRKVERGAEPVSGAEAVPMAPFDRSGKWSVSPVTSTADREAYCAL